MESRNLRILWVTINRNHRVSFNIFTPLQEELGKHYDVEILSKDLGKLAMSFQQEYFANPKGYKKGLNPQQINKNFDVVITDALFAFMGEDWQKITIPKYVLIEDQHGQVREMVQKANKDFDYFLVRYRDTFYKNYPNIQRKRVIWLPHSINPEYFTDYKEKKTVGCLSTGCVGAKTYPLRNKIHTELSGEEYYKRVGRPKESQDGEKWPIGKDYAKLINQSCIAFGCTSRFNYPVMKLFEIPACNTILCSDLTPEMKDLGFIAGKNMLAIDIQTNIRKFLQIYLRDLDSMVEIAENGYNLIHSRHLVEHRARELAQTLRKHV